MENKVLQMLLEHNVEFNKEIKQCRQYKGDKRKDSYAIVFYLQCAS